MSWSLYSYTLPASAAISNTGLQLCIITSPLLPLDVLMACSRDLKLKDLHINVFRNPPWRWSTRKIPMDFQFWPVKYP